MPPVEYITSPLDSMSFRIRRGFYIYFKFYIINIIGKDSESVL